MMRASPTRIVLVTLGLAATGAVCGAFLGGLAVVVQFYPTMPKVQHWLHLVSGVFRFGANIGMMRGAFFAPIVGWLFLRRISLGRAIGQTALGVLAGVVVGCFTSPRQCGVYGVYGFLIAGAGLWLAPVLRRLIGKAPRLQPLT